MNWMNEVKRLSLVFLIITVTFGCASSSYRNISIKEEGKSLTSIVVGYRDQGALTGGYYILIEESVNGWYIKNISPIPIIGRRNNRQEVIYIDKSLKYIQPYFEKVKHFNGSTFECSPILDKKQFYTPCESNLMTNNIMMSIGKNIVSAASTLGLASGTHKAVDQIKIAKIVEQTSLITKTSEYQMLNKKAEDECQALKQKVEDFKNKIIVEPVITDRSGFYSGGITFDTIVNVKNFNCRTDLNNIEFSVLINPRYHDNSFNFSTDSQLFSLSYNHEGHRLNPIIIINSKNFKDVYPKYLNEDDLLIAEFDGVRIKFFNKTKFFIKIKTVSVYYDGEIAILDMPIEIPPDASMKAPVDITKYGLGNVRNKGCYSNITKDKIANSVILFGFAVKYTLVAQNIDNTMYKLKHYNVLQVLQGTGVGMPQDLNRMKGDIEIKI